MLSWFTNSLHSSRTTDVRYLHCDSAYLMHILIKKKNNNLIWLKKFQKNLTKQVRRLGSSNPSKIRKITWNPHVWVVFSSYKKETFQLVWLFYATFEVLDISVEGCVWWQAAVLLTHQQHWTTWVCSAFLSIVLINQRHGYKETRRRHGGG